MTEIGRQPRLSMCNKFVKMFYSVLFSFFFFLLWSASFLVTFGLGFYIMLHNDNKTKPDHSITLTEFFDLPWLAMVKTSTM